jgi:hypothetical protein
MNTVKITDMVGKGSFSCNVNELVKCIDLDAIPFDLGSILLSNLFHHSSLHEASLFKTLFLTALIYFSNYSLVHLALR